jgi:hypothetical protein
MTFWIMRWVLAKTVHVIPCLFLFACCTSIIDDIFLIIHTSSFHSIQWPGTAYLKEFKGKYDPHLIIAPNIILVNWKEHLLYSSCIKKILSFPFLVRYLLSKLIFLLCWCKGPKAEVVLSNNLLFCVFFIY